MKKGTKLVVLTLILASVLFVDAKKKWKEMTSEDWNQIDRDTDKEEDEEEEAAPKPAPTPAFDPMNPTAHLVPTLSLRFR